MAKKKLSTEEILARARAEVTGEKQEESTGGDGDAQSDAPEPEEAAGEEHTQEQPTAAEEGQPEAPAAAEDDESSPKPAAPSGGKPKSTKDILAAARAQGAPGGGAEEKPAAEKPAAQKPAESKSAGQGKPKSTKDILAAARAEAGAGAKPKGGAPEKQKPAAKTSPKKAGASKPAPETVPGERPPVQEMVKALREGRRLPEDRPDGAEKRQPKPPKKPPVATRKPEKDQKTTRRSVLTALVATPFALAWTAFAGVGALFTAVLARFMMPNVLVEPPTKFKVGPPTDYPPGTVSTKWKDQFGIWLVHAPYQGQNIIYALISVCTHLGCTPNWLQGEQKFKCPCHGSGFYITGVNFEGPAPRPLERAAIRLAPDGMLEVDKSQAFQQELGQWESPDSYVEVA